MCGIMGAVVEQNQDIVDTLVDGLKYLEYRGYDSAGIAILDNNEVLTRIRTTAKIDTLEKLIKESHLKSQIGIAHTRWATHGYPDEKNAHPHIAENKVAIVHNGIIENYQSIRTQLLTDACVLESETDSELIAHLILKYIKRGATFLFATRKAISELTGAFAIAVMYCKEPKQLLAIRNGSPLVIGISDHGNYISSDAKALSRVADKVVFLEDGDIALISDKQILIYDEEGKEINRPIHTLTKKETELMQDKGKYKHFMLKEIFEQPDAVKATLQGRITKSNVLPEAFGVDATRIFSQVKHVHIVGCGTSFHAGLVAKYWFQELAKISCSVEIASEYRHQHPIVNPNTLFITLSQSGETADTLAALRLAKKYPYLSTLTICNVAGSALTRESDLVFMTNAGPEIGVASTKAFTTQLVGLLLLVLSCIHSHSENKENLSPLVHELLQLPKYISEVLELDEQIHKIAYSFLSIDHALFIGRGIEFPIALEGALKLKEISYIHAQACPSGELKHGTLALVDKDTPVISVAPNNLLMNKIKSNFEEVLARQGKLLIFADKTFDINKKEVTLVTMPPIDCHLSPIIYSIPLQLLAYHVAALKGKHIDQPRNLAKSVTVE